MLIEKAKNKDDLINKLNLIIKNTSNEEVLRELQNIILYALDGALCGIEKKDLIQKIDKKVGDEYMSTLIDRLTAENRRVLNEGIQKGLETGIKTGIKTGMKTGMIDGRKKERKEVVKKMLLMDFKDDIILSVSGVTKKELEEIKNKI